LKNLYLVQVADKYGPNSFLPVAISYQWMYASTSKLVKDNFQVADVLIEKKPPRKYVEELKEEPHVMMLSSYVWNWEYNKFLASEIKKKYPNCLTITGGPHVDKRDTEFFEKYPMFDIAVMGEGEEASREILKRYLKDEDYTDIPHVFPKGGKLCPLPSRLQDLDRIPSPILTGFYDRIIKDVEEEHGPQMWQVTYETLRGCPYKCTFCDIGDDYWQKIKMFDMERVKQEIDWMSDRKIEYVAVCDSNWGLMPRDVDITKYVIKKKQETGYPKFWDVTWAKANSDRIYEIAMLDKEAGTRLFKGVTFAMQSLHEPTLEASKRLNLKQDEALEYLQKYQEENIPTYSELIWPMPNETYDSLKNGIQRLIDLGQKSFLMVHPLVITYNATMGQPWYQQKYGLKTEEVPLDTFYLSVEELEDYIIEKTYAVVETGTAPKDEVLKGHLLSHVLIVLYYYGWGHYLMEYISNVYNVNQTDLSEKMINYFTNKKETLIGSEIYETHESLRKVFEEKAFWGRQVLGDDDVFWEYKGATSIVFAKNREKLKQELKDFCLNEFGNNLSDVVDFNLDMCVDYNTTYPITNEYDLDTIVNTITDNKTNLEISHWDDEDLSEIEFYHKAYHYQRKTRYWKNDIFIKK
jgi:putative methyltransferase